MPASTFIVYDTNAMEALLDHLVLLYEAQLSALEAHFDTKTEAGINHSKMTLSDFFFSLQVEAIQPDIFLEVGAFSATTSLAIKEALPNAHCAAFEANIHNYNFFRQEYNYEKAGVRYINAAVGEKNGKENFYIQTSVAGQTVGRIRANNSLLTRQQAEVEYEQLKVDMYSIDSFLRSQNFNIKENKISLWIDAEGAAFSVLKGTRNALKSVQSVLIEVEEKRYWEDQVLAQRVFKYLLKEGFVPVARDFEAPFQYNVLFVRPAVTRVPAYKICRSAYFRSIGGGRES